MSVRIPARSWRQGHTLVEMLVALVAGGLLLTGIGTILDAQARVAADIRRAALEADAVRTTAAVLGAELRYLLPEDVRAVTAESLAFRVVRGVAYPCTAPGVAAWDGMRLPSTAKDSVAGALTGRTAALIDINNVAPGSLGADDPCARAALPLIRMVMEPEIPGEPAFVFESGAYHVAAGALRYRLGAEGRQPLTEEWLDPAESGFRSGHGARLASIELVGQRRQGSVVSAGHRIILEFPALNIRTEATRAEP